MKKLMAVLAAVALVWAAAALVATAVGAGRAAIQKQHDQIEAVLDAASK